MRAILHTLCGCRKEIDVPAFPRRVRIKVPIARSPKEMLTTPPRVFEWSGTDDGVLHYQERAA